MRSTSHNLALVPALVASARPLTRMRYPFTLGVASGDPLPGSIVIWTRLAPRPELADGGMPRTPVTLRWEVARDDRFQHVVSAGSSLAHPDFAHSVHVDVTGLVPGAVYWYRFLCAGHESPIGCTRVAPARCGPQESVRFAVASGQNYEDGSYAAYDAIAREDLDFLLFIGDYISAEAPRADRVRRHDGEAACTTLAQLRMRHALYKSDPDLQAVHRALPWIVARGTSLCAPAAAQALWEHMPMRRSRFARSTTLDTASQDRFGFGGVMELSLPVSRGAAARASRELRASSCHWKLAVRCSAHAPLRAGANSVLLGAAPESSSVAQLAPFGARGELPLPLFVATSISSSQQMGPVALDDGALFRDRRHGYLRCELDRSAFRADFMVMPQAARGAPLTRCAGYLLESGSGRLMHVAER